MDYIAAAMRGDVARLAELSFDCVMCGLCTSRCPAELCQYNIAILGRRLYAKYVAPRAEHLAKMVEQVNQDRYESNASRVDEDRRRRLKETLQREGDGARTNGRRMDPQRQNVPIKESIES